MILEEYDDEVLSHAEFHKISNDNPQQNNLDIDVFKNDPEAYQEESLF